MDSATCFRTKNGRFLELVSIERLFLIYVSSYECRFVFFTKKETVPPEDKNEFVLNSNIKPKDALLRLFCFDNILVLSSSERSDLDIISIRLLS